MSNSEDKEKKPKKKKGPIRLEAVAPFGIFIALVIAYFVLFFDSHLRKGIEWGATLGNGAEVNVGYLKTSFLGASFKMGEIQITNPSNPIRNRFQVGKVHFKFLWDAFLRAKIVVEDSGIEDILVNTKRESPGEVLPKEESQSMLGEVRRKVINAAREEIRDSALGELADLLEGFDPSSKIKELGELKSAKHIASLEKELNEKEKKWNQTLTSLPSDGSFNNLKNEVSSIRVGGNPAQIKGQIGRLQGVIGKSRDQVNKVQNTAKSLTSDLAQFQTKISQIDQMVEEDKRNIERKLKLPRVDKKSMAKSLFGSDTLDKVEDAEKYAALARKHLSSDRKKKEETKKERSTGKSYQFGSPGGYPRFWLKKATITSKQSEDSDFSGNVEGKIMHVVTDPKQVNKRTSITLRADFPKQNVRAIVFKGVFDHRGDVPKDEIIASVAEYPVPEKQFSNTDSLKFGFKSAIGRGKIRAAMEGDRISLESWNKFKNVNYQIESTSQILKGTLEDAVKAVPGIRVDAKAAGKWPNMAWSVSTNLADALARGLQRQLSGKLNAARKKIDRMIRGQISGKRQALTNQFDSKKSAITSQVNSKIQKAKAIQNQANAKINDAKKKASNVTKKATKGLKKIIPMGFGL